MSTEENYNVMLRYRAVLQETVKHIDDISHDLDALQKEFDPITLPIAYFHMGRVLHDLQMIKKEVTRYVSEM